MRFTARRSRHPSRWRGVRALPSGRHTRQHPWPPSPLPVKAEVDVATPEPLQVDAEVKLDTDDQPVNIEVKGGLMGIF
jgi:hypothetical protein